MSANTKHVKPFLKYSLLPGLLPRFYEMFASGFSYFAFLMANIYAIVRLIPAGHPYLYAANMGRFGVRHVVAEASRNLVFKRENIDQILMYFMLLIALVLVFSQFIFLLLAVASPVSMAGAAGFAAYFGADPLIDHSQDIAFILMDRVFGVPGIFDSCVTTATPCYQMTPQLTYDTVNVSVIPVAPWPFHDALHSMFQFYSTGLLIVGVLIIIYYIIAITAETAQTGTPFGRRFNTVWAPLRLVVAIGLLVPIGTGLNSAQYIVLYAAKMGSNLATNGWVQFNNTLGASIGGGGLVDSNNMIATPNTPDPKELIAFMILAKACAIMEDSALQETGGVYLQGQRGAPLDPNTRNAITPWLVKAIGAPNIEQFAISHAGGTAFAPIISYTDARTFYDQGDILVRFGELNPARYSRDKGGVKPYCGELILKNTALYEPGALAVQEAYYNLIAMMWGDGDINNIAHHYAYMAHTNVPLIPGGAGVLTSTLSSAWPNIAMPTEPTPADFTAIGDTYRGLIETIITNAVTTQQGSSDMQLPAQLLARGWGGAGIWYNRIAQMNGALVGASRNLPEVKSYPKTMTITMQQHKMLDENATGFLSQLTPEIKGVIVDVPRGDTEAKAQSAYKAIMEGAGLAQSSITQKKTGNPLVDGINLIFGTEGLMNLNSPENRNVHPLAQLSGVGKSLIESAIMNLGLGAGGGLACISGTDAADIGCGLMSTSFGIAGLGLTIGFILFYVVPFLPFVYFFFAVGNWVKSIFEAMVGAPLWALGHLRIDGDGLPGEGAQNGYYLIFEIFLRPILIVFGLLASILIFSAMATVLFDVWQIVTANATGFNSVNPQDSASGTVAQALSWSRSKVDQMFFLVIYAVIMYMMALSSFKLIDMIPNSILRWMGSSVTSFGDNAQDAAQSLTQYAAIGGGMIFQQGLGGVEGGVKGIRQTQGK